MFDLIAPFRSLLRKEPPAVLAERTGSGNGVILFVHGLGSNALATWKAIYDLCKQDPNLEQYTLAVFEYPTKKFRPVLGSPSISLIDLAKGLQTEIRVRFSGRDVTLVGHSMGGLVVRQYLAGEASDGSTHQTRAFLYAVPNRGAPLASAGSAVSANNRHLEILRPDDEILRRLNADWERLRVFDTFQVRHAVAGQDEVVPISSALPVGDDDHDFLPTFTHSTVVAPTEPDDIRYLVLRNFLLGRPKVDPAPLEHNRIPPDPLFNAYSPSNEDFYVTRALDDELERSMAAGHVWLEGPSGCGKTAALTRRVHAFKWRLLQIILAPYGSVGATALFRAMCTEFADLSGHPNPIPLDADVPALMHTFRSLARENSDDILGVLVEEVPLLDSEVSEFTEHMVNLAQMLEAHDDTRGRVLIFFSSIKPIASTCEASMKFRGMFPIITAGAWTRDDLLKLTDLLANIINPSLDTNERLEIATEANGSAWFVKCVFRRWRNGTAKGHTLRQILESVKVELSS